MGPRPYQLGKRAASKEETRRRIVLAAVALHGEKGIATTTMKEIAARADVGEGTVFHHFPSYVDVVRACGAYLGSITRAPTPDLFHGLRSLSARIDVLVREMFAYYERYPQYERARCDQDKLPVLALAVRGREGAREEAVREALRIAVKDELTVKTVMALTDFAVCRALTADGTSHREAANQVTEVILSWLAARRRSRFTE